MKKIIVSLCFVLGVILFKVSCSSLSSISSSLDSGEIGVSFLDESSMIIHLDRDNIVLNLDDRIEDNNIIDKLSIVYNGSDFSFTYSSKKFCVGYFYDCDFIYLYKDGDFNDADVYFYNSKTASLLNDIPIPSYDVNTPISIIWDSKNYMIMTY